MFEGTSCINDPIIISPDLAFRAEATTGEGSIWHPDRNTLFWVDIEGKTLYEYIPDLQNCRSWQFDRMVSTVVPETDSTVVVALQNEIIRVNLTDGNTASIAPIPDNNGKIRCNDGKCDPSGRLWIGTMGFGAPKGAASLYCVWADGTVETKLTKVTISNGIVWSANKKYMYYNDTPTRKIIRFRYDDSSGDILYDGVAVNIPEGTGSPDGMTIDCNDNLWVAQWGGGGVYCYNPYTGDLLTKIVVPAPHVASCAFGGDKLDTLYITTARAGLSEEQLEEYPLRPLEVVGIGGVYLPVPVEGQTEALELSLEACDVVLCYNGGVYLVLDGEVLGRQAEGIKADRIEDVVTLHPLFPADDVHGGKGPGMSHMESLSGGIGELDEPIEFRPGGVPRDSGKGLFLQPLFLPLLFNRRKIVLHDDLLFELVSEMESIHAFVPGSPRRRRKPVRPVFLFERGLPRG